MAAKVTLKQIAREVGVSPSAVSLVLNDRPCRISDEKRAQIKDTAARLQYVPNQIARSLVTQQSRTLGLIVPNIESRFFSSLAKNLEVRCRERGYALFIMNSDGDPENDSKLVSLLVNRGVDGLFLVVSQEIDPDPAFVSQLGSLPVPLVMVDRVVGGVPCDSVRYDSEQGGYLATECLLEAGHSRIACLVNTASNTGRERLSGYRRALVMHEVPFDESLVFESDYYIADAARAATHVMETDATAVFASSDNIALGVLKALYERDLRVPGDYSMVSYDNSAADALFEPALTAIEQNVSVLSDNAMDLMMGRIKGSEDGGRAPFDERVLPPRLVPQASVASR